MRAYTFGLAGSALQRHFLVLGCMTECVSGVMPNYSSTIR